MTPRQFLDIAKDFDVDSPYRQNLLLEGILVALIQNLDGKESGG